MNNKDLIHLILTIAEAYLPVLFYSFIVCRGKEVRVTFKYGIFAIVKLVPLPQPALAPVKNSNLSPVPA